MIEILSQLSESPLSISYHSSILQVTATINGVSIIIEGSTSEAFEPVVISTAPLAMRLQQQPCLISIMPNDMSLSHKLAAWLERRLTRDLYDIYILYERFEATPDLDILDKRLLNIHYLKGIKPRPKIKSTQEFLAFLKEQVQSIKPELIEAQLQGLIDDRELEGIGTHIKIIILGLRF